MINRLDRYLLFQLWNSFLPFFGALYLIASVVSFVQISSYTSIIKISFSEMFMLYLAQAPSLLLYTLPITFFVGVMMTFSRLSADMETIVMFSLKADMKQMLRPFIAIALVLSLALFVLGFIVSPKAQYLQKALLFAKRDDAQITIRASEFGQKFGDWLLFVGREDEAGSYRDLVLYSRTDVNKAGLFVVANQASMANTDGLLSLKLFSGKSYETTATTIRQMDFEQMRLNESGRVRSLEYNGLIEHWRQVNESRIVTREFVWAMLAVLFVPLCLPAAALGIHSPRFTKNRTGVWAFVLSLLFYVPAMTLGDRAGLIALIVPPLWFGFSLWLFRRKLSVF